MQFQTVLSWFLGLGTGYSTQKFYILKKIVYV